MSIRRFEDLQVWQVARELNRGVYRATQSQKLGSDHAMANQMKRAAISIASNIAEGFERGTRKQQIEFCYIAKASAGELRAQVTLAHDVKLIDDTVRDWLMGTCEECSRMLAGYIKHLQQTRDRFPGLKLARRSSADEDGEQATQGH